MVVRLLKRAIPVPLRPPVRRVVALLLRPPRRQTKPARRSRPRQHAWRKRLKRVWRKRLRPLWRKRLKPNLVERAKVLYRRYVFWRAMRRVSALPRDAVVPATVLSDLIYGWDNLWSAKHEYIGAFLRHARATDGTILECGSGLSTILLGLVAHRTGNKVWSLEHDPSWAKKVRSTLKRYGIESAELCETDLRDYGPYLWYDPPKDRMPEDFSVVVCDGPPGKTAGGRYGVLPIMKSHLKPGCVVLLDDAGREGEREIVARWAEELGTDYEIRGSEKPFAIIALPSTNQEEKLP